MRVLETVEGGPHWYALDESRTWCDPIVVWDIYEDGYAMAMTIDGADGILHNAICPAVGGEILHADDLPKGFLADYFRNADSDERRRLKSALLWWEDSEEDREREIQWMKKALAASPNAN